MTLSEKQRRFTKMVALMISWAEHQGYELTFGHAWRDEHTQTALVEEGLSQTTNSKHLDRLAVDFNLFVDNEYQSDSAAYEPLGQYWKSLDPDNVWGGDWESLRDGNHFEYAG